MAVRPSPSCSILQANLHHSETATAQIWKWLEANKTAVILIQEPWVRKGAICGLRNIGGKLTVYTGPDNPRTCIYTTSNLYVEPLTSFCSRDLCAVKVRGAQVASDLSEVVLASAYMPEAEDPPPHDLTRLVAHCEESKLQLIVATDSNAHHPLWGMKTSNNRGKLLVEYLMTTNLNILNTGSKPTFVNKRSKTIIDLTLATEEISRNIMNWHVSEELSCSDHRWLRFDIQVNTIAKTPWRNPRKTDRVLYEKHLKQTLPALVPL